MKEIVIWTMVSVLLFISVLAITVIAIIKSDKRLIVPGLVTFLLCLGVSAYTLLIAASKAYNKARQSYTTVSDLFKQRNGAEIYTGLFGKPDTNCVFVLHYKDAIIPKMDDAISLHFKSCPAELKRILAGDKYSEEKISSEDVEDYTDLGGKKWFRPQRLGDTVLVYRLNDEEGAFSRTIFANITLTEAYAVDVNF